MSYGSCSVSQKKYIRLILCHVIIRVVLNNSQGSQKEKGGKSFKN